MKVKILWVEGKRADSPSFVPDLRRKGFNIEVVPTGSAAQACLSDAGADLIIINASSLRSSGERICQVIRTGWQKLPILVIANPDRPMPKDACADVVLRLPFTSRKLVNRIIPMLPVVSNNLLQSGPISLDVDRRLVRCDEKEGHLTPRLTLLLKILMNHPGEVLEREDLFRQVWSTEYTGDTRTLDVHISWLRQAIEVDPRKPRYLRTIRGVGYRLDV